MVAGETPAVQRRSGALRWVAVGALSAALLVAVLLQRDTVTEAMAQLRSLSLVTLGLLVLLAVYERWSRADIVRRLLGGTSLARSVAIHDVGTAISKGVPMGGALGTAVRWSIAREARIPTTRFATMLIAYGIATTFVSWLLPLGALLVDVGGRSIEAVDIVLIAVMSVVLVASATFWTVVLRSDRAERWSAGRLQWLWDRVAGRFPSLSDHDPAAGVTVVRAELLAIAKRPWWLLARTAGAQLCGAVILFVALRGVGVGSELGTTEFLRIFFVTHLLGTFAPTPGGVGVVEAGMTGALVAAGVDTPVALAGVLVYRFLTYVVPIVFGALLYVGWRTGRLTARAQTGIPRFAVETPGP